MCGVLLMTMPVDASLYTEWEYAQAIRAAQGKQWADAQQRMGRLMIDNPEHAGLQYDSGVAAYQMKEYQKADAYFQQATKNEHASATLKERAYVNLGNTKVALNALQEAINSYEAALALNPHDERARYNLEQVRKRLAQQKQEEEQEQQNQHDQQNQQSKQDQQQQQQSSSKKRQEQSEQQDKQDGQREQQNQQQNGEEEGKQHESSTEERKEQDADKQQEGNQKEGSDNESDSERRNQEQEQRGDTHDSSPQKRDDSYDKQDAYDDDHHTKESDKSQEMQEGALDEREGKEDKFAKQRHKTVEDELAPQDRWMARVLQRREQEEERANKRMVKAMIDKELAGKDGQNCW